MNRNRWTGFLEFVTWTNLGRAPSLQVCNTSRSRVFAKAKLLRQWYFESVRKTTTIGRKVDHWIENQTFHEGVTSMQWIGTNVFGHFLLDWKFSCSYWTSPRYVTVEIFALYEMTRSRRKECFMAILRVISYLSVIADPCHNAFPVTSAVRPELYDERQTPHMISLMSSFTAEAKVITWLAGAFVSK